VRARNNNSTLAERMGGTIGFRDNNPHGTIMTLTIPQRLTKVDSAVKSRSGNMYHDDDLSCETQPRMRQVSMEAMAAENELLLGAKRILVGSLTHSYMHTFHLVLAASLM
jgi:hypothetical protein